MKQLTDFPPILQRLVSDMSADQLQQSLISEGVFRHCPAVTTTQIGINLAVSITVDLQSFREESISLITLENENSTWIALIRNFDHRVILASQEPIKVVLSTLKSLGFEFDWTNRMQFDSSPQPINAFSEFVRLADKKRFCWKLGCTTCGAWSYRRGLVLLSFGAMPGSKRWARLERLINLSPGDNRISEIFDEEFCRLLGDVSLVDIAQSCRFPDWLGFIGVVLHDMHLCKSDSVAAVMCSWASQLSDMISFDPARSAKIRRLSMDEESHLSWRDLEDVEMALRSSGIPQNSRGPL